MIDKNKVYEIQQKLLEDSINYDCIGNDVGLYYMEARGIMNMADEILRELDKDD